MVMKRILFVCIACCVLWACSNDWAVVVTSPDAATTKNVELETVEIVLETAGTLAEKLGDKNSCGRKVDCVRSVQCAGCQLYAQFAKVESFGYEEGDNSRR